MATIFAKTPTDKALILGTREALIYPFSSPGWADIRLGIFLSSTNATNNDDTTGLTESFGYSTVADRVWVGFKDNSNDFPNLTTSNFLGFATQQVSQNLSQSALTNAVLWTTPGTSFIYAGTTKTNGPNVFSADFPGNLYPGGYSSLMIIKVTRSGTTYILSVSNYGNTVNANYSSTPTIAEIRTALRTNTFYSTITATIPQVPDAVFVYWPFYNSKLRIHSIALEKFA